MNDSIETQQWSEGDAYESFMGKWSYKVATNFLEWLKYKPKSKWLEVGCGTGSLTSAILKYADPSFLIACDSSDQFVKFTKNRISDPRVSVFHAGIENLPSVLNGFDLVVSGFGVKFSPDLNQSISKMLNGTHPGSTIAAYVWDYTDRMDLLRIFWDTVSEIDPSAKDLDEGIRFPMCKQNILETIFRECGLDEIKSKAIDIQTNFKKFSDFWQPFLGGTGPAPFYVDSLSEIKRSALKDSLELKLKSNLDGTINLVARAWAISGVVT